MASKIWRKLPCKKIELQLKGTLNGGQSFRWKRIENADQNEQWLGVFSDCVWILYQDENYLYYQVYENDTDSKKANGQLRDKNEIESKAIYDNLLKNYFRLDINIEKYYKEWSNRDIYFKEAAKQFYGIRILNQDIVENLFSFICSQNNHINRISSMVEKLCQFYGKKICDINGISYFSFPKIENLANDSIENDLRKAGFGYRARYISESAKQILENGGQDYLDKLKLLDYKDAKKELCKLTGIGAKVADCICLMSLNHLDVIPVDTHVFQIAKTFYLKHDLNKQKTVTNKVYDQISEFFKELFGPLAGWAHTVLFCADLKKFQNEVNQEIEPKKKKLKK